MPTFIQKDGERNRTLVHSLAPFLRESLRLNSLMNPAQIKESDLQSCRWVDFGLGKGVTDPKHDISVYAVPRIVKSALHGELIQGFPKVDATPQCYYQEHEFGFGDFFRWVYFADPQGGAGVFGLDWSICAWAASGIAHTMLQVCDVAESCLTHGIPAMAELALLDGCMCERSYNYELRQSLQLITVQDWANGKERFLSSGNRCPRCGLQTRTKNTNFCNRCGCQPRLILQEDNDHD